MTEGETLAEEYYYKTYPVTLNIGEEERKKEVTDIFLVGLKAGRPKWHKVSEQLPTEEKDYLVKLTDGTIDIMAIALDGDLEPYLLTPKFDFNKDVEKWCEIPGEIE